MAAGGEGISMRRVEQVAATDPEPRGEAPTGAVVAFAGAFAVGGLAALQARVNGALGVAVGDGVSAALLSYGTGLALLALFLLAARRPRAVLGLLRRGFATGAIPLWWIAASLAGSFAVLAQSITVGVIGVALFSVGIVAGRTVTALILDATGIALGRVRRASAWRVFAAVLTIGAVVLGAAAGPLLAVPWWLLVFPVMAGGCLAFQQAVNGGLARVTESGLGAVILNFTAGTVVLGLLWGVRFAFGAVPGALPADPLLYTGGLLGLLFIFLTAVLVRRVGILVFGIGAVVGQLSASLLIDVTWPVSDRGMPAVFAVSVAVAVVAAVLAAEPWRARRGGRAATVVG